MQRTARTLRLSALTLPLLLAACSTTRPDAVLPDPTQVTATPPSGEAPETANVTPASSVVLREPTGIAGAAQFIPDPAASGSQAVNLIGNQGAARFTAPSAGRYAVRLRGRGLNYAGWPIVALRSNGREFARATLDSNTYVLRSLGTFDLTAGQLLEVVFMNDAYGGSGMDRNAVVDHLQFELAGTTSVPTPTPTPAPTSPTPTPTPPTPAGALDVKSFGAKGDGTTNDTAALQRAASSGKSLFFPPGTYLVSAPIVFRSPANITVSGSSATLKLASNWAVNGGSLGALSFHNATNVVVTGLIVQGFAQRQASMWTPRMDGLSVVGGSNVTIDRVEVRDVQSLGINAENTRFLTVRASTLSRVHGTSLGCGSCSNTTFVGNQIDGGANPTSTTDNPHGGLGIMLHMGDTALVENNTIRNIWNTATKSEGTHNVTYRGNTIDTFGKDGIKIQPYPEKGVAQVRGGVVENNVVRGFRAWKWDGSGNVLMQGVAGGRVTGNKLYGNNDPAKIDTAIKVNAYTGQSRDIVVEGNEIYDASVGVLVETENMTVVRRNKFVSGARTMKHCVNIGRGAGTVVEGNAFEGFSSICTMLYNGVDNVVLRSNTFSNGDTGVFLNGGDSTGVQVASNTFATTVSRPVNAIGSFTCFGNVGNVSTTCR